jgi:hypothetical protein
MRFFLALTVFVCYSSLAVAEGNLTKSAFNMAVIQSLPAITEPAPVAAKAAPAFKTVTQTTYRAPQGHTHTCTSCGNTWDHTANPTHTCAKCKGHPPMSPRGGYYADPTPRMVPVTRTVRVPVDGTETYTNTQPVIVPSRPVVQAAPVRSVGIQLYRYGVSSNCANGNCATSR